MWFQLSLLLSLCLSGPGEGLALEPANESANQNYGLLLLRTGTYHAAIEPLERITKSKSADETDRVELTEAYLKSGLKSRGDDELSELHGPLDAERFDSIASAYRAP